eukprot:2242648-Pleurochrysis_carterae.AAC.4
MLDIKLRKGRHKAAKGEGRLLGFGFHIARLWNQSWVRAVFACRKTKVKGCARRGRRKSGKPSRLKMACTGAVATAEEVAAVRTRTQCECGCHSRRQQQIPE